jgi:hypothetical protein
MTEFKNCNIHGPLVKKNPQGKFMPHDMVEQGILPPNWKSQPELPSFDHCNVINFKVPDGVKLINCNVVPVDEESQNAAKEP